MRKVVVVLTVVFVMLVGPVLSVLAGAAYGGVITDCRYSEATHFPGGTGTGQIAERFSTLRPDIGEPSTLTVVAPATFEVLAQTCSGGFSWLNIRYTSGTACENDYWYGYYGYYGPAGCDDFDATDLVGWALESQIYFDGTYGPGRWLEAAAQPS